MDASSEPNTTLAVLGAGPKAAAIAAKAAALRLAGLRPPRVCVIERQGPAANWSGANGYTDGAQPLGTPPDKDVGFPYTRSWGHASGEVRRHTLAFSWNAFLIDRDEYADWVDRGRPRPPHRLWGEYLSWVFARAGAPCVRASINRAEWVDGHWQLGGEGEGGPVSLGADGLVVTGTGPPLRVPGQPREHPRVTNGRSFWTRLAAFRELSRPVTVGVVGGGETAASIAITLLTVLPRGSVVELVTASGVPYTRGEGSWENRLYSNPLPDWPRLAERHRREFLRRTDRGVFSVQAQETLDRLEGLRTLAGRVAHLDAREDGVVLDLNDEGEREQVAFDHVVVAVGFDAAWFVHLLGPRARAGLSTVLGTDDLGAAAFERHMGADLAVVDFLPRLHLPMLAGFAVGPGFPNLSCLGLLADRVLGAHVQPGPAHLATARTANG